MKIMIALLLYSVPIAIGFVKLELGDALPLFKILGFLGFVCLGIAGGFLFRWLDRKGLFL